MKVNLLVSRCPLAPQEGIWSANSSHMHLLRYINIAIQTTVQGMHTELNYTQKNIYIFPELKSHPLMWFKHCCEHSKWFYLVPFCQVLDVLFLMCVILQHSILGKVKVRSNIGYAPKRERGWAILEMFYSNIIQYIYNLADAFIQSDLRAPIFLRMGSPGNRTHYPGVAMLYLDAWQGSKCFVKPQFNMSYKAFIKRCSCHSL
jgi:hypothetical protein